MPLCFTPYDKNENTFYDEIYTRYPKPIVEGPKRVSSPFPGQMPETETESETESQLDETASESISEPEAEQGPNNSEFELHPQLEPEKETESTVPESKLPEPEQESAAISNSLPEPQSLVLLESPDQLQPAEQSGKQPNNSIPSNSRNVARKSGMRSSESSFIDSTEIIYKKIDGCYIRCDHLDKKIFRSVLRLLDIRNDDEFVSKYPIIKEPIPIYRPDSPVPSECPSDNPSLLQTISSSNTILSPVSYPVQSRSPSPEQHLESSHEELLEIIDDIPEKPQPSYQLKAIDIQPIHSTPIKSPNHFNNISSRHVPEIRSQWVVTKVTIKTKNTSEVKFDIQNERRSSSQSKVLFNSKTNENDIISVDDKLFGMIENSSGNRFNNNQMIESDCDSSASDSDYPTTTTERPSTPKPRIEFRKLTFPSSTNIQHGKPIKAKIVTHKSKILETCDPALIQKYQHESDYDSEEVLVVPKMNKTVKANANKKLPMDFESEPEMMLASADFDDDYDSEPAFNFTYIPHNHYIEELKAKPKRGRKKKTEIQPPKVPKKRGRKPKSKVPLIEAHSQKLQHDFISGQENVNNSQYLSSSINSNPSKYLKSYGKSNIHAKNQINSGFADDQTSNHLLSKMITNSEIQFGYPPQEEKPIVKRKRGRPRIHPINNTKKILNSVEFATPKVNIVKPIVLSDDDSELDIGDIVGQYSQVRSGKDLSALRRRKQRESAAISQSRESFSIQRSRTLSIEILQPNNLMQTMTSIPPHEEEITDQNLLSSTSNTDNDQKKTPKTYVNTENDIDSNRVSSSNTLGECDEKKPKPITHSLETNFTVDSELPDQIYEDDDIESPEYEPLVTNSRNELDAIEYNQPKTRKPRVFLKRTRGKPRWTRHRKKTTTQIRHIQPQMIPTSVTEVSTTIDDIIISPLNISSIPIVFDNFSATVIETPQPKKRGRKRKNPLEPPKIIVETDKRPRSSRLIQNIN